MKLMTLANTFFVCGAALIARSAIADIHNIPLPPGYRERAQAYNVAYSDAKEDMQAGNYIRAEAGFRNAIAADADMGSAHLGLAEALAAEGRTIEALQAYYVYFHPSPTVSWLGGTVAPKANLEYALLLNQNGQWAAAVGYYNAALPDLVKWDYKASLKLDPNTPQPAALAAAAHIGLGLYENFEYEPDSNTKALQEYNAALQLEPDWDTANYYYGYGWQKLSPTERAKFGTLQQAKAHLQKAERTGNASVKAASQKVLKELG